jgi:hypothetical protein
MPSETKGSAGSGWSAMKKFVAGALLGVGLASGGVWWFVIRDTTHSQPIYQQLLNRSNAPSAEGHKFADNVQQTDWQALDMGGGQYGPQLIGSVEIGPGDYATPDRYRNGVLVGIVVKDSTDPRKIADTYRNGRYFDEATCVYIRSLETAPGTWAWSWNSKPYNGGCGGLPTSTWTDSLWRERVQSPTPTTDGYFGAAAYPNAMRFEQVTRADPSQPEPIITAFRCGDAVCHLGLPEGDAGKLAGREHIGAPNEPVSAQSRISLYFDDQKLALPKPGGGLEMTGPRASIIPEPGIELLEEDDFKPKGGHPEGVLIARVFVRDLQGSVYGKVLQQGWTGVFLRKRYFFFWRLSSAVIDAQGNIVREIEAINVKRKEWDPKPPKRGFGTVRFAWLKDEGVWLPCDEGCCQASMN